jgi:thioredoxin 1
MTLSPVTDQTFQNMVLDSTVPVLLDFSAEWCGPCRQLEPILEKLSQEYQGKLVIARIDVDSNPDTPARFQVMGIPTLILFVNGQPAERLSGFMPRERLLQKISPHIK